MKATIQIATSNGRQEVSLGALHLARRRIFITSEIDAELADNVIQQLLWLDGESNEAIDIYINSPGGSVSSGLAIYDILQTIEAPVNMICVGMAASMAALLFASGPKGRRYMYPHARVMIHEAHLAGGVGGSAMSIQNTAAEMLRTQQIVNEILAAHTGRTTGEVAQAVAYDHFMDAKEAIRFGICDTIVGAGADAWDARESDENDTDNDD